jgi:hypothetical protein
MLHSTIRLLILQQQLRLRLLLQLLLLFLLRPRPRWREARRRALAKDDLAKLGVHVRQRQEVLPDRQPLRAAPTLALDDRRVLLPRAVAHAAREARLEAAARAALAARARRRAGVVRGAAVAAAALGGPRGGVEAAALREEGVAHLLRHVGDVGECRAGAEGAARELLLFAASASAGLLRLVIGPRVIAEAAMRGADATALVG